MRVLLKIRELWVHTATHTEDDLHQFDQTIIFLKPANEQPRISFNTKLSEQVRTRADFTYKITPTTISIVDTGLGSRSVTVDIEAILREIEHWHQGSVTTFKIMCRDGKGFWHGVRWDGKTASYFALQEIDKRQACKKL
jgi:hypothetical protein